MIRNQSRLGVSDGRAGDARQTTARTDLEGDSAIIVELIIIDDDIIIIELESAAWRSTRAGGRAPHQSMVGVDISAQLIRTYLRGRR
jgi:hypothetical protein